MIKALSQNLPVRDEDFDKIYPPNIQNLSEKHWTPINVARSAAEFLVTKPGTKVLDIGSGVGKFCIVGSQTSSGIFFGVEQRKKLANISERIIRRFDLQNITIIHSNIIDVDFKEFDSFYFFNSFYENIEMSARIDHSVKVSLNKYVEYREYLKTQLESLPVGTRIVTYNGYDSEIPPSFALIKTELNFNLKFWVKNNRGMTISLLH